MGANPLKTIGNLDALVNKIKTEEEIKKGIKLEWNDENLQSEWNKYVAQISSATAKNAFNHVNISIEDDATIKAYIPSALIQEKILAEKRLLSDLRLKFDENLKINFVTELSMFPNYTTIPAKKLLSEEEKYLMLVKKNPHLGKLVEKFKLKLDKK